MKRVFLTLTLCFFLISPGQVFSEILFSEDFEDTVGAPSFNFTGKQQDKHHPECTEESRVYVGGDRGWVWRMIFKGAREDPGCSRLAAALMGRRPGR